MATAKTKDKPAKTDPKSEAKQRFSVSKSDDHTISIKIVIPWNEVEKARSEVVEELIKEVELPGFRKGKAPLDLAQAKLAKEKVNEEVLKKILTKEYVEAVKANNIQPIINPKIHIEAFDEGTNLEFTALTCEEPKIDLKNYKEEVKKLKPTPKVIVPGKPETETPKVTLEQIFEAVLKSSEVKIPKILVEQETDRLLSQLLSELKTIGVSLDQFLANRGKTGDELRAEYMDKADNDLKLEFLLRKIADSEKITVEENDIQQAIGAITDENQKKEILKNPYYLASVIRQQKTIDFLSKL